MVGNSIKTKKKMKENATETAKVLDKMPKLYDYFQNVPKQSRDK